MYVDIICADTLLIIFKVVTENEKCYFNNEWYVHVLFACARSDDFG